MSAARTFWIALGIVATLMVVRLLTALDSSIRMMPAAASPSEVPPGKGAALVLIVGFGVLFLVLVVGIGLAFFDLGGRRQEEAERLQTMISKALRREVGPVPVLPVAHVPRSRTSPVLIEITGNVPTTEFRDAIVRVVDREIARRQPYYRIDNRVSVDEAVTPAA